eukprot:TRINITY_DN2041_c0_g1_i1.p1 TRINITY_DN2041_c0_g1~~TRINITY_DN2041_c0_g1_i1.p1  ORF type:complete len:165 (+),score=48.83 TRINITY_DN2041_c0_g1_i1:66-560(+)
MARLCRSLGSVLSRRVRVSARIPALLSLNSTRVASARVFFSTDSSHPDFQPQQKAPQERNVSEVIKNDISTHKVFLYMKGHPIAPQCGFSNQVVKILEKEGVKFGSRNVLEDPAVRAGIKEFTGWPTLPQLFIDGKFIGGCDIVTDLFQSGELSETLKKAGAKQ